MAASLTSIFHDLREVDIYEHEAMSRHTSFGIGGPADVLAMPCSPVALRDLLLLCWDSGCRPVIIGNGTNIIVRDGGVRGVVIKLGDKLGRIERRGNSIVAQAGAGLATVCVQAADWGLAGLGFAAGIPGSVGGAVWMNAGANGGDVGQLVQRVTACSPDGGEVILSHDELQFSYRHSVLQHLPLIVAEVEFHLQPGDPQELHAQLCETIQARCAKQPIAQPSAGCIFKRPPDDFAGRLVEAVGAKGMRVGAAEISPKHANFIVNTGGATAAQVLELIEQVRKKVHAAHGVWLQPEVCVVGEDPG